MSVGVASFEAAVIDREDALVKVFCLEKVLVSEKEEVSLLKEVVRVKGLGLPEGLEGLLVIN